MQVVDEENNRAATNRRSNRFCWLRAGFVASGQLCLSGAARGHPLKETDGARLAVNRQFKLPAVQAVDEAAVLIDHSHRRLHQVRVDAQHIVVLSLRLWLLCINEW